MQYETYYGCISYDLRALILTQWLSQIFLAHIPKKTGLLVKVYVLGIQLVRGDVDRAVAEGRA